MCAKPIGIDLGTTNSVISYYDKGNANVIKIRGEKLVPSVVFIDGKGSVIIGEEAKKRILINPEQTLSSTKRFIGNSAWRKEINGINYTPVDTAREVLSYLKREAEKELSSPITKAVITVPAYFTDKQCEDTKKAAEKAGFEVLRLQPEPTAAAIRYGFERDNKVNQTLLIIDLGGGTFDVSLLEIGGGNYRVKGVDGNSKLGGDDFDNAIVEYINIWVEENLGTSVRDNPLAQQKLKESAEKIKIELSQVKSTDIDIPAVAPGVNIEISKFKRTDFEQLIEPYLNQVVEKTNNVIVKAGMGIDDINRVVLVGGSCKHPIIQDLVRKHFKEPFIATDMDTCVSQGAATVCANLMAPTKIFEFEDVIAHSLGIDMYDASQEELIFVPLLKRNTKYPTKSVVLGSAQAGQEKVVMSVFRGEHVNQPERNDKLGELSMIISKEFLGEIPNMVAAIFELDDNRILTFTAVEVPLTPAVFQDTGIKDLLEIADGNNSVVPYEPFREFLNRHNFRTWQVRISTN